MSEPFPQRWANDLLADIIERAARAGLVLAVHGTTIELRREPLPEGWTRVAVRVKGAA